MKYQISILILLFLVAFAFSCTGSVVEFSEVDAKIESAVDCFSGPPGPPKDGKKGFFLLMEAIELASSETDFSRDFKHKILTAKNLSGETSIFNPEGVTLLNEAYSSINSGERFQMPEDIASIEQARELVLQKVEDARKELKQGNIEDSVRSLLEVAIMVVTPMRREQ
jgi:hypothetical protein